MLALLGHLLRRHRRRADGDGQRATSRRRCAAAASRCSGRRRASRACSPRSSSACSGRWSASRPRSRSSPPALVVAMVLAVRGLRIAQCVAARSPSPLLAVVCVVAAVRVRRRSRSSAPGSDREAVQRGRRGRAAAGAEQILAGGKPFAVFRTRRPRAAVDLRPDRRRRRSTAATPGPACSPGRRASASPSAPARASASTCSGTQMARRGARRAACEVVHDFTLAGHPEPRPHLARRALGRRDGVHRRPRLRGARAVLDRGDDHRPARPASRSRTSRRTSRSPTAARSSTRATATSGA